MPLTVQISRNMNLEFMCCILYGLSNIFVRTEKKKMSSDLTQYNNNNNTSQVLENTLLNNDAKYLSK
jgi:hypothetical protein